MTSPAWREVALSKLSSVVGRERAAEVFATTLVEIGLADLTSVDDLYLFAESVGKRAGFVGAVGALLSVHAVIHGARSIPPPPTR